MYPISGLNRPQSTEPPTAFTDFAPACNLTSSFISF
jgi:hypothetical protein